MTGTYKIQGNNIPYTNTGETAIPAGTLVIIGTIAGIAACTIEPGATGTVATTGVFTFGKDATDITAGAVVYYDDSADAVTITASGNTTIGVAIAAAGTSATTADVRLNN